MNSIKPNPERFKLDRIGLFIIRHLHSPFDGSRAQIRRLFDRPYLFWLKLIGPQDELLLLAIVAVRDDCLRVELDTIDGGVRRGDGSIARLFGIDNIMRPSGKPLRSL